ncbi:MAG: hypothetical protein ACREKL_04840 [Chthoniobacterales bacterium]
MKTIVAAALGILVATVSRGADSSSRITAEMQAQIDAQKKAVAAWAANPVLVKAVVAQNAKGPIPDMTNRTWKSLKPGDPLVQSFEKNAAGLWLAKKLSASDGMYREAFLSAAKGEKVAFVEKTTSYLHAGQPKFDEPMSGKIWQGPPEFDKSSYSYTVQIAAPVHSGGKPVGVLVVGISMKMIKTMAQ